MNCAAPNEKHKADFPSPPLIFTANRFLPADPLWEQVQPTRVQLLADLLEEIYMDGDPCGTGSARYLQYDVQRVHWYEDENQSKQQRFCYLYVELVHPYIFSTLLSFVFLLFLLIIGVCQLTTHGGLGLAPSRSFLVPSRQQRWAWNLNKGARVSRTKMWLYKSWQKKKRRRNASGWSLKEVLFVHHWLRVALEVSDERCLWKAREVKEFFKR